MAAVNSRNADRYADRMARLVTRISDELLAQVDELVADGVIQSRSDAVRIGLRRVVDESRRRRIADAIVAGYLTRPQIPGEVGWPDETTVAMMGNEP